MDHKDIITEEDCQKIVKVVSQKSEANLLNYFIIKSEAVGFLGEYFQLELSYEAGNGVRKELCFLKTEPISNENHKTFVQDCGLFKKEAFIYDQIIPELTRNTELEFAPLCLLAKEEVLVLEDLKNRNFNIIRRDYTLEECEALLKTLANFHGSSIIYEEKRRTPGDIFSFEQHLEKLPEATFSFDENDPKYKWLKCATNCIIDMMKTTEIYDENMERKLLKIIFGGELKKSIQPSKTFRNVLTHNDLWCNNIFLNRNEECLIIDFQLVRYTPPAYDLIMALFLNNSIEFLNDNLVFLLEFYYDKLSSLLKENKLDPRVIFPANELYSSFARYKIVALIESTMFAFSAYLSEDVSTYIRSDCERYQSYTFSSRTPYIMKCFLNDSFYRKKIFGLLQTLAEDLQKRTC